MFVTDRIQTVGMLTRRKSGKFVPSLHKHSSQTSSRRQTVTFGGYSTVFCPKFAFYHTHYAYLVSNSTKVSVHQQTPEILTARWNATIQTMPSNLSLNRFQGSYVLRKRFSLFHHTLVSRPAGDDGPSPSQGWLRRTLPNQPLQQHPMVSTSQAQSKGNAE